MTHDSPALVTGKTTIPKKGQKQTWKRDFDYVFNLIGMMIGLGNVWRFPYLCYKNGGGAFLIAYWIVILVLIFPLTILETGLGQFTKHGPIKAWRIIPIYKGLGFSMAFLLFYGNVFYPMLLAWALRWLVASFSAEMSWTKCDNNWNSNSCLPIFQNLSNNSTADEFQENITRTTSVEEFWRLNILDLSPGIEDLGGVKIDIFICLAVIWIGTYFSIWKGISWTTKIVYVTATLPLAMLLVVIIRGVTLDGAAKGISVYLKPNMTSLTNVELWTDASSQVLYSMGTCSGGLIAMSSYNKHHHNFFRDTLILTFANACASFLAGFAIFSVLGFLAETKNTTVSEVAESGPGLVFVAYPTALSLLPLPQLWISLFFIMLILLGFDSLFVFQEAFMCCVRDLFPRLFRYKRSDEISIGILISLMFLLGIPMTTRGGMYVLNIMNAYSITGWSLYFMALNEMIAVGWLYGSDRMCDNIKQMLGYDVPRVWLKICWKFIGPIMAMVLMIYFLVSYKPLTYDRDYVYPVWADVIGWITALNSILCVPIVAIYAIWTSKGNSLVEKFLSSIEPRIAITEEKKEISSNDNELGLLNVTEQP